MANAEFKFKISLDSTDLISPAQKASENLDKVIKSLTDVSKQGDEAGEVTEKTGEEFRKLGDTSIAANLKKEFDTLGKVTNAAGTRLNKLAKNYSSLAETLEKHSERLQKNVASFSVLGRGLKDLDTTIDQLKPDKIKEFSTAIASLKGVKFPKINATQINAINLFGETFGKLKDKVEDFKDVGVVVAAALNPIKKVLTEINPLLTEFNSNLKHTQDNISDFERIKKTVEALEQWKEQTEEIKRKQSDLTNEISRTGEQIDSLSAKTQESLQDLAKGSKTLKDSLTSEISKASEKVNHLGDNLDDLKAKFKQSMATSAEGVRQLTGSLNGLKSMFLGMAGAFATTFTLDGVKNAANTYQTLATQIKLIKDPTQETTAVLNELFEVASKSSQPVESTVEAYKTLKESTAKLGLGHQELKSITETLTKAIAAGGSTAEQAKNGMTQFAQALSMGTLSGQNLNSVMEQIPGVARSIARGLGIAYGDLKEYAQTTKITTEQVVQALKADAQETEKIYQTMGTSIGGSITNLQNAFTKFIGENDFITNKLANGIQYLADNFNTLVSGVKYLIMVFAGYKAMKMYETFAADAKGALTFRETIALARAKMSEYLATIKSVSAAKVTARARNIAYTTSLGLLKGATIGVTVAWRAFNMAVKASVIGAVLSGALWLVEKLIDGVKWLYNKFMEWLNGSEEKLKDLSGTLEEQIEQNERYFQEANKGYTELTAKIAKAKEELVAFKEVAKTGPGAYSIVKRKEDELAAMEQQLEKTKQAMEGYAERRKQLLAQQEQEKAPLPPPEVNIPEVKMPTGGTSKVDEYARNIENLKNRLSDLNAEYQMFMQTGGQQLSELDKVNMKINQQAEGYKNLSEAQLETYRQLAAEIDHVNALMSMAQQMKENDTQIERLQLELELVAENSAIAEERLLQYERELELKQALKGLNEEEQAQLTANYQQRWQLEDKLKAARESGMTMFIKNLKESAPTFKDFAQLGVQSFNQVADGIAEMVVTGKGNLKDLAKNILKNFATMLVKAAIFKGTLAVMNMVVPGSGTAVATMINASGGAGGGGGKAGGWFQVFNLGSGGGKGFMSGGYTGGIRRDEVRGVVHGKEFVINAGATQKYSPALFDAFNRGEIDPNIFAKNGSGSSGNNAPVVNIINNANGVSVSQDIASNGELYVYIENTVKDEVTRSMAAYKAESESV